MNKFVTGNGKELTIMELKPLIQAEVTLEKIHPRPRIGTKEGSPLG